MTATRHAFEACHRLTRRVIHEQASYCRAFHSFSIIFPFFYHGDAILLGVISFFQKTDNACIIMKFTRERVNKRRLKRSPRSLQLFELFPYERETRPRKLTLHIGCSSEKNPRKLVAALWRSERQVEIKILCVAVARGALNFEPLRDTST